MDSPVSQTTSVTKKLTHKDREVRPLTAADVREIALEAAGFTPEFAGEFTRKAVDKLIQKLEADKIQFFAFEGQVVDERVVQDTTSQIAAAKALADIGMSVAALNRKSAEEKPHTPTVNIDLSGWTVQPPAPKPEDPIDATSSPA